MGYYEENTLGYIAPRDHLLRALDCCVFLAASGIGMAMTYLLHGLIICAVVGSNIRIRPLKAALSSEAQY
jgi:hypothetical protein